MGRDCHVTNPVEALSQVCDENDEHTAEISMRLWIHNNDILISW